MSVKLGETVRFGFTTHQFDTGAAVDADAPPTAQAYANGSAVAGASVANLGTGEYEVAVVATTGNGFAVGDFCTVMVSATVNGVAAKACVGEFAVRATSIDDIPLVVGVPQLYAPDSMTRVVGDNEGGVVGDLAAHDEVYAQTGEVAGSGLEWVIQRTASDIGQQPSVCRISGFYNGSASHVVSIQVYNFTLAAYETRGTMLTRTSAFDYVIPLMTDDHDPATGEMRIRLLHNAATFNAAHYVRIDWLSFEKVGANTAVSSDVAAILAAVQQYLDAAVSSRLATAGYTTPPTVGEIEDAVLDALTADHPTAGTIGKAIADAGSAADPLLNTVPGAYLPGTAGYKLGQIGTASVEVTTAVAVDGTLELIRGDSYAAGEVSFSSDDWVDLTTAIEVRLTIRRRTEAFPPGSGSDGVLLTVTDTVASRVAGAGTQSVTFAMTAAQTAALLPGTQTGKYDIQATFAGGIVKTLAVSVVNVVEDQTR